MITEKEIDPMAWQVKQALTPALPTPAFRARLHTGLQLAAQHRHGQVMRVAPRNEAPWGGVLVSVAALGSIAGLIALLLRVRQGARSSAQALPREMGL